MEMIRVSVTLVALSVFLFIFYGPWQTLVVDWARQRMFEARDNLFDAARDGDLSFESAEYREARNIVERMIRFCHHVSWPRLLLIEMSPVKMTSPDRRNITDLVNSLPEGRGKEKAVEAFATVAYALMLCIFGRSIFLCLAFLFIRGLRLMNNGIKSFLLKLVDRDSRAVDFEKPVLKRASYRHS